MMPNQIHNSLAHTDHFGQYCLVMILWGLPNMTNASGRNSTHWRVVKAERDHWKNLVGMHCLKWKPARPFAKAKLNLTRYSSVQPDADGLVSGFKSVIDGLVVGGVLVNDRWDNIGMPSYDWVKDLPKTGRIRIELKALLSDMISEGGADDKKRRKGATGKPRA